MDLFNSFFVSSSLGGSSLNLNELEQIKASMVFEIALAEVNRRTLVDVQTEPDVFDVKVQTTKENLGKILDLFNEAREARNEFISNYPEWRIIRERSIEKLEAYGKSMHKDKFKCNVAKIVGSSIAVAGGVATIAGAVVAPSSAATIAGGGTSLFGGAMVFGTFVIRHWFVKTKMKKAKNILKEDQKAFQTMTKWFERTLDLEEAVKAVVGFQVMKTLAEKLKDFANDFKSKKATLFRTAVKKILDLILETDNNLVASVGIKLASIILTFCVVVVVSRNCDILDGVILTNCMVFGVLSGLNFGVEVGRGILMAVKGGTDAAGISSDLAGAVFHGIFGGIGLTLNVINIILTSIDVHKGSWSEEGIEILNTARKLGDELELLDKVYDGLVRDETRTVGNAEMSRRKKNRSNDLMTSIDVHKGSRSEQGFQIVNATPRMVEDELERLNKEYDRLEREIHAQSVLLKRLAEEPPQSIDLTEILGFKF